MKYLLTLISAFLLLLPDAQAQVKYSNEFLSIGIGARQMGMGGAGSARIDDVTAGYWNPAGLCDLQGKMDFGLMHSEYFAGLAKLDYGGFAMKTDHSGVIGVSLIRFAVDDIPNTLDLIDQDGNVRYDRISEFSAADMGILLSYARQTGIPGLQAGANVKLVYRHTGDFAKAWGFGLDAAVRYSVSGWRFSAVARDVTGTFNAWSYDTTLLSKAFAMTGNELPENTLEVTVPRLILAAARDFKLNDRLTLGMGLDLHTTFDGRRHVLLPLGPVGIDPYVGGELVFADWLFARVGVGNFQMIPGLDGKRNLNLQPALGIGLQYRNFHIDYALTDVGNLSIAQYSNLISLRYMLK